MNQFEDIINFRMPRYDELPSIGIYRDQLISYIEQELSPFKMGKETFITSAMVNNYVVSHIIPPTEKKKYSRRHVAGVLVICILKQIYSIAEIGELLKIQNETMDIEIAYDYFCEELEAALKAAFLLKGFAEDSSKTNNASRFFVRHSVMAFALKLHAKKLLAEFAK